MILYDFLKQWSVQTSVQIKSCVLQLIMLSQKVRYIALVIARGATTPLISKLFCLVKLLSS